MDRKLTALGITDGIGSLLWGAQELGFEVIGNHEWRPYYNTGTFEKNFNAPYLTEYEMIGNQHVGVDLICSHAECGNFSNLYTGKNRDARQLDPGDIWDFIHLTQQYKPKFFLADNLTKSLMAVTPAAWREAFPEYDITFQWVSNYHYGNTQFNRRRMFILGSHKDLKFRFVPGEFEHEQQLKDVIADIPDGTANHQKMQLTDMTQWANYQIGKMGSERLTLEQMQPWFADARVGANLPYYNKAGELKSKPGYSVVRSAHRSPVLSGGGGFFDNHWIHDGHYRPLTMRERMRIQGFPDDYVLVPGEYEFGSKEHRCLIKQTGKSMPNQFPTYFADQIKKFLENRVNVVKEGRGKRLTRIPAEIQEDMYFNPKLYYSEEELTFVPELEEEGGTSSAE